jgi:prefoldin subunit 5
VGNIRSPKGELYKGRWTSSIESRAKLVADIAGKAGSQSSLNLLLDVIQVVRRRINKVEADHDELVQFLTTMRNLKLLDSPEVQLLVGESKLFFMRKPWWVRHLEAFCEFRKEFPALVTSEDEEQVRNVLREVAKETAEQHSSDPDEVREEAEIIQSLAQQLDVDVTQHVSYLEACAENLDSLVPPDNSVDNKPLESKPHRCSDEEIDSLFGMLSK